MTQYTPGLDGKSLIIISWCQFADDALWIFASLNNHAGSFMSI